jgi:hypothetical protein
MADEKEKETKLTVTVEAELAHRLDEILRAGLANAGHIDEEEARSIRDASPTRAKQASLVLDPKTAAMLSQMLREGLVNAAAAHQANNNSVASAVGRVLEEKSKPTKKQE